MGTNFFIKNVLLFKAAHLILSAGCNKKGTTPCRNTGWQFSAE